MAKDKTSQANTWKQRYDIARDNQQGMFQKFADWYDLFYATVNTKNIAPWRSKIFIPVITSKAWNLIAKFVGLKPGFEVTVRDENVDSTELQAKADKMQKKLEYDYDNPNLSEPIRDKIMSPLVDAVVTGTGIAKVPWHVKTDVRYERIVGPDGTVDLTKEKKIESKYGCNDLIPVNIFNVFVAPTATNLYDAPWIIIKEYKTLNELKDMGEKGYYKNLDQLSKARAESDEFALYKKSRNQLMGQDDKVAADETLDHVAVYECYEKGRIITYASGGAKDNKESWVELRNEPNAYWHGKYPLVKFTVKQRPYEFWGEGIFEVTQRLSSAINDVFNHYMDNWNLSVDGMLLIEETSNVNDYVVQPGGEITYRGTAPTQFKFPEPNPNQVNNILTVIEKAIEDVTISNYATGATNSATDQTSGTATGIMRLQEAAGDMISFMRANFQQAINEIGKMWLSNNQQFFDRTITVPDMKDNEQGTMQITPADLQGNMELRIDDASMEPMSKEQRRQARVGFIQQTLQLQQASMQQAQTMGTKPLALNFDELFEGMAEDFGEKTADKYLADQEELAAAQEQQMAAQQQQQAASQESEMQKMAIKHQMEMEKAGMAQQQKQQQSQQEADQQVAAMLPDLQAGGFL